MHIKNRRESLLLTRFALRSHPRLKGWSKPRMEVYEVQTIRQNRPAQFKNKPVRIVAIQQQTVILSSALDALNEKEEVRQYPLNQPVRTGYNAGLYDASCEYYFACWTSEQKWNRYCLKTKRAYQWEIYTSKIRLIPSYFTKRALKWYGRRFKASAKALWKRFFNKAKTN